MVVALLNSQPWKETKMKISAVSMRRVPDGVEISVSAVLPDNEELDGTELGRFEQVIKEFASAQVSVRKEPQTSGEPATGRRQRGAAAPAEPAQETKTSDAAPTAGRRSRGASNAAPTDPGPVTSPAPQAAEGRRRRSAPEPEAAAPAEGRRRRTVEPEPEKLTDADLVRAASKANADLIAAGKTPSEAQAAILDLVFQYDAEGQPADTGSETIQEIKQADRADFLAKLKALK
jgi:hypothetical protein